MRGRERYEIRHVGLIDGAVWLLSFGETSKKVIVMPDDIQKLSELRVKLRKSADELPDFGQYQDKTQRTDDVGKVHRMIETALEATDERSTFLDVISIKSFLASIRKIGLK